MRAIVCIFLALSMAACAKDHAAAPSTPRADIFISEYSTLQHDACISVPISNCDAQFMLDMFIDDLETYYSKTNVVALCSSIDCYNYKLLEIKVQALP